MAKHLASSVSPSYRSLKWSLIQSCVTLLGVFVLIHRLYAYRNTFLYLVAGDKDGSTYQGETLVWTDCGNIAGRKLECSRITVPIDHFHADSQPHLSFDLPLIRLRGDDGSRNLFVSPGGPGVSGVDFLHNRGELFVHIIGSGFHVVAFDARGINGARPAALCYATRADQARLSTSPIKSIEQSVEGFEWTKGFVKSCQDTTGEHGAYINTPQIAADMNIILQAFGQDEIHFWGISWGSVLGQTYASMYPERASHVIIDGVVNSTSWYEDLITDSGTLNDAEKVIYGFFDECIKAGDRCPLAEFASTASRLQEQTLDLIRQLEKPISVYVDSQHWGLLHSQDLLYNGLFGTLYSPATWWSTADRIAQLLRGNPSEAFLAWGGQGPYDGWIKDEALYFITNNDQRTGFEHWPQDRQEFLDLIQPVLNETMFSLALHLELYKRQQWPLPKTHTFRQPKKVKTPNPMLVMSTEWDPVTPLATTQSALQTFEGSRLIKLVAYGHTTFAMRSECVHNHVRNYLYHDQLPAKDASCQIDGEYFVKPENGVSESLEPATHQWLVRDVPITQ